MKRRKFAIDCVELIAWEVDSHANVDTTGCLIVESDLDEVKLSRLAISASEQIASEADSADETEVTPDRLFEKLSRMSGSIWRPSW